MFQLSQLMYFVALTLFCYVIVSVLHKCLVQKKFNWRYLKLLPISILFEILHLCILVNYVDPIGLHL